MADVLEKAGFEAQADLESKFGKGRASFLRVDLTSQHEVEGLFKEIVRRHNQLDIVINNAGMLACLKNIHSIYSEAYIAGLFGNWGSDVPMSRWKKIIDVNSTSVIHVAWEALKASVQLKKPVNLINTSSIAGLYPAHSVVYCAYVP